MTSIVAIVALVVVAFPLLVYLLQERLIFFPQPLAEAQRAQVVHRFSFVKEIFLKSEDGKRFLRVGPDDSGGSGLPEVRRPAGKPEHERRPPR